MTALILFVSDTFDRVGNRQYILVCQRASISDWFSFLTGLYFVHAQMSTKRTLFQPERVQDGVLA